MKLHVGIKQDEDHRFFFAMGNNERCYVDPPVKLRPAGKYYPTANTNEKPYHLEIWNEETQSWIPLNNRLKARISNV